MDVKRRLARVVSVLAVAILLGHLVQTMAATNATQAESSAPALAEPKIIVPVAAGPQSAVASTPAVLVPAIPAAAPARPAMPSPTVAQTASPEAKPGLAAITPATDLPAPPPAAALASVTPERAAPARVPAPPAPAIIATTEPAPSIVPKSMEPLLQPQTACRDEMDLAVVADAMIEITLLSPCHADERLVLRHGPLMITTRTTAKGSAFLKIPALDAAGEVTLRFADGTAITGAVPVSGMANLRRFAVQWLDRDTFGLHAFESGAGYGDAGHLSAANPGNLPLTSLAGGGHLLLLGDATTTRPMLAEVYTFPDGPADAVEIAIEAQVTADTCGRELLAQVITSHAGVVDVSDLVLAMPDCSALGDILVLKNPTQDLALAAAN